MKAYEALAAVYDRLGEKPNYDDYASFFKACCTRRGLAPELVLDLGCGTGAMTLAMADLGYDMIGVDGSPEMLSRAYERCYSTGRSGILFLNQDMREFELYGTVDVTVSCLDCINHITKPTELDTVFSLVHNYLIPDGLFIFDINGKYKFENVYSDRSYVMEEDGGVCIWQNFYNEKSKLCDFYITLFKGEADGRYERYDETQRERMYPLETIKKKLNKNGFDFIGAYSDFEFSPGSDNSERIYIAAKCKKIRSK